MMVSVGCQECQECQDEASKRRWLALVRHGESATGNPPQRGMGDERVSWEDGGGDWPVMCACCAHAMYMAALHFPFVLVSCYQYAVCDEAEAACAVCVVQMQ